MNYNTAGESIFSKRKVLALFAVVLMLGTVFAIVSYSDASSANDDPYLTFSSSTKKSDVQSKLGTKTSDWEIGTGNERTLTLNGLNLKMTEEYQAVIYVDSSIKLTIHVKGTNVIESASGYNPHCLWANTDVTIIGDGRANSSLTLIADPAPSGEMSVGMYAVNHDDLKVTIKDVTFIKQCSAIRPPIIPF